MKNGHSAIYPLMEEGEGMSSKRLKHSPDGHLNQTTKKFANTQEGKHAEAEEPMHVQKKYHMVRHPQHGVVDPTPGYGVPMSGIGSIKKHKIG